MTVSAIRTPQDGGKSAITCNATRKSKACCRWVWPPFQRHTLQVFQSINILTPATKSLSRYRQLPQHAHRCMHLHSSSRITASPQSCVQSASQPFLLYHTRRVQTLQAAGVAAPFCFANDSFSIAASIILFPLMMDVVQMTIFLRPGEIPS